MLYIFCVIITNRLYSTVIIFLHMYMYIYILLSCIIAYLLIRDSCFPDSKSSPNSTVHHSYSHLARRYTSFALEIPDVAFWWPSPSSSSMSRFPMN